jgi:uncharacterized protein YbjQ (UPF0145 family)
MIVTTCNEVPGRPISKYVGIVRGIVVRPPGIGQGLAGGLQQFFGGNIEAYAEVCDAARSEALKRMTNHASKLGATAVVGMRYDATEFSQGVTEVLAYGTAVLLDAGKTDDQLLSVEAVKEENEAAKTLLQEAKVGHRIQHQ